MVRGEYFEAYNGDIPASAWGVTTPTQESPAVLNDGYGDEPATTGQINDGYGDSLMPAEQATREL